MLTRACALSAAALLLPTQTLASDGVLEISQTCAVMTGCIDNSGGIGDTPGFPVTIEISGSYVLTSDLVVSDPNTDAIFIATSPVTLDLNGHEIRGPVSCSGFGSGVTCDPGTGHGVRGEARARITIVDGSISQFASHGIRVASRSHIERVVVERNGGNGIMVFDDSVVIGCRSYRNGGKGFEVNDSSSVASSTAASNGSNGFTLGRGSSISGSTARDNGDTGISAGRASVIKSCSVIDNEGNGIFAVDSTVMDSAASENTLDGIRAQGSVVRGSAATLNGGDGIEIFNQSLATGNMASGNTGDGIDANLRSSVHGNSVSDNTGFGLQLGSDSGYQDNVISQGLIGTGTVDGGVDVGGNVCNGSLTCP